MPAWADSDGIVPPVEGTGAPTLLDRVRKRLAADFGEGRVDAVEQELRQVLGCDPGDWLARGFFTRHAARFRLQMYGLLATDVLNPSDVDQAAEYRAEWRADERRWFREGKLTRPGRYEDQS